MPHSAFHCSILLSLLLFTGIWCHAGGIFIPSWEKRKGDGGAGPSSAGAAGAGVADAAAGGGVAGGDSALPEEGLEEEETEPLAGADPPVELPGADGSPEEPAADEEPPPEEPVAAVGLDAEPPPAPAPDEAPEDAPPPELPEAGEVPEGAVPADGLPEPAPRSPPAELAAPLESFGVNVPVRALVVGALSGFGGAVPATLAAGGRSGCRFPCSGSGRTDACGNARGAAVVRHGAAVIVAPAGGIDAASAVVAIAVPVGVRAVIGGNPGGSRSRGGGCASCRRTGI
ncbi:hypothetical protein LJK88_02940 [Paenibacillus sp. P26]|nr:hypothetical protein LJK88_02940 [Paenibacillus sp. P26]